ncbi:hypothetical protein GCM10022419_124440 [Nonomuraea rosea]|uniref:Uncharacterized protein n=1 Tax=Nonomuraea rosea TaxID=638574 RepID=A0ABP6ZU11_9ACTN
MSRRPSGTLESGWRGFVAQEFGTLAALDERDIAETVIDEPNRRLWRVVDAAYDRLIRTECGNKLSRGPVDCAACNLANGVRYVAIEIDQPGVPPGNEHALRVNVSVGRRPSGISWREVRERRLLLPWYGSHHSRCDQRGWAIVRCDLEIGSRHNESSRS